MSGVFGGSSVWRHADGTECQHKLCQDSEAPAGLYCAVTHSDVVLDDGGPRTGRITVVLNNDEGRFPDEPLTQWYAQRSALDPDVPAEHGRHRADPLPGMYDSWPQALRYLGALTVGSVLLVALLAGVALSVIYLLS